MKLPTTDVRVRISLIFNIAYALFNWVIGAYNSSWWFITLGAYYTLLCVMRFSVLKIGECYTDDIGTERFVERFIGLLLVLLSVCLLGVVVLSVVSRRGENHNEIVMISIALYAFVKVTNAIVGLFKVRRTKSSIMKAIRNISMADASVSIFSLQRSMLVTFEGMGEAQINIFNLLTGTAVCLTVLILGINLMGGRIINMAKSKLVDAGHKVSNSVVSGYKTIEKGVVGGYKKIEHGVVEGYTKIEDKFIDTYLTREGETVEEAKKRLREQK